MEQLKLKLLIRLALDSSSKSAPVGIKPVHLPGRRAERDGAQEADGTAPSNHLAWYVPYLYLALPCTVLAVGSCNQRHASHTRIASWCVSGVEKAALSRVVSLAELGRIPNGAE
jgi:hypothetical protein